MTDSEKVSKEDAERVQRRTSSDRRIPESDRRSADRVVAEAKPRRQNPERRKNKGE